MRITGFKLSYLSNCADHGFQVLVFENCADHGFILIKILNLGGGHFQKNLLFFHRKISFWVDFNVLCLLYFFKDLSFFFPNKTRLFFLLLTLK